MKSIYLKKHSKTERQSFSFRHVHVPHMYDKFHFHEELELNCVYSGKGTRYIGANAEAFKDIDLVLVGSKVSHVWINDKEYYLEDKNKHAEVINILFLNDFLGKEFLNLPEMKHIRDMFVRAKSGIVFYGDTKKMVLDEIKSLSERSDSDQLSGFIQVLNKLAQSKEYKQLLPGGLGENIQISDIDKINKVYDYIIQNFTQKIYIKELAQIANMNPSAFCRYFKRVSKKTVVEFVTELRINYACKLLQEQQLNITQIAFESGFSNPAMFFRKFKQIMGRTPKSYFAEISN